MDHAQLEKILRQTFEDHTLSRGERQALKEVFKDLGPHSDQLPFIRNKAFDLVQDFAKSPKFNKEALKWLEQVIKIVSNVQSSTQIKSSVYFSPGEDCRRAVVNNLGNATRTIDICVFTISDDQISEAILKAFERGVKVRVISDDNKKEDRGSDVTFLQNKGVPVVFDSSSHHMHHKFALIDQKMLLNGSFNWTRSASFGNQENLVATNDPHLLTQFSEEFEKLWQQFS